MELPFELKNLIENEIEKINIKDLQKNAENISLKYRNDSGKGKRLVTEDIESISYAAARMPATYGAVYTALKNTVELYNENIKTVLDVGAGTGAGSWAANNFFELEKINCLEREDSMLKYGKYFMEKSEDLVLNTAIWEKFDLINSDISQIETNSADLVICSYVINELDEKDRKTALNKLWNMTNKILLIIEPGTPEGFKHINSIRENLTELGGKVIAPCPNINKCPMPYNDWCHSTCRVARTKIHKILKNGDVPYEDEKFSYIAFCKNENCKFKKDSIARVLRHPKIESGKITLQLCTSDGIVEKVITKKQKELFKIARKCNCGDGIEL